MIYMTVKIGFSGPKLSGYKINPRLALQAGIDSVKSRLGRGIGPDDRSAERLSPAGQRAKIRIGALPVKNMIRTGQTIEEIKIHNADGRRASASIYSTRGRIITGKWGYLAQFSPNDELAIVNAIAADIAQQKPVQISRTH